MKITVSNSTTTKAYSLTNVAPSKPYMTVSNLTGWFLPLTTKTKSGYNFKVTKGTNTYRAMEYTSASGSASYYSTSDSPGNMSSTTALTRASTSDTSYLTCVSTSGTTYLTRVSTSDTSYGTCASTSGTTYLTRASTSATSYGTRASTSSTTYYTRVSTSGTSYQTRASTSGATYYTRVSTSGTNYGTRASTSDAKYATRASTSSTVYSTRASTSSTNYGTRASTSTTIYQTRASTSGSSQYFTPVTSGSGTSYVAVASYQFKYITSTNKLSQLIGAFSTTEVTQKFSVGQTTPVNINDLLKGSVNFNANLLTIMSYSGGTSSNAHSGYHSAATYYIYSNNLRSTIKGGEGAVYYSPNNPLANKQIQATTGINVNIFTGMTSSTNPVNIATVSSTLNTYQKYISIVNRLISISIVNSIPSGNTTSYTSIRTFVNGSLFYQYTAISTTYYTRASTSNTVYGTRASTSGTTYLTRASTSTTIYKTRASTSGATYYTRVSTSGTTYLTRASTSDAKYATRASTSSTIYLTRASTSDIKYGTKVSTSTTIYQTRASTSGTNYGTRASTSGTTYLTRASTSDTVYGTRASTSATSYLTRISTSGYSGVSSSSSSMNTWE